MTLPTTLCPGVPHRDHADPDATCPRDAPWWEPPHLELLRQLDEMGVERPKQQVRCPYCRELVAGLLAPCDNPDCRRRALDEDMRLVRMEDR